MVECSRYSQASYDNHNQLLSTLLQLQFNSLRCVIIANVSCIHMVVKPVQSCVAVSVVCTTATVATLSYLVPWSYTSPMHAPLIPNKLYVPTLTAICTTCRCTKQNKKIEDLQRWCGHSGRSGLGRTTFLPHGAMPSREGVAPQGLLSCTGAD